MRYLWSLLIPLAAIAATLAAAEPLLRSAALHRIEQRLFDLARRFHTDRKIALFEDLSALGSSTLVTTIAAAVGIGLLLGGRMRDGVLLAAVCALSGATGTWMKRFTRRTRPGSPTGATFGSSFPSSHTLMATACWLTLGALAADATSGALHGWVVATAVAVVCAVGLARIFLHVHYLSDVVAGWALGVAWAAAAMLARG
jgi:undecaprenyl-diphosphatase